MSRVPEVLLVGHDASRTGAPTVAAAFARWAKRTERADVRTALLRGGALADDGAWPDASSPSGAEAALARLAAPTVHRPRLERAARRFADRPIVVANTLAAWRAASTVSHRDSLVCWVHELDGVADALVDPAERATLIARTDRFVAVDACVSTMVVDRWGVPSDRVAVVAPFVDAPEATRPPADAPVRVLGAGSLVPRKGADLFVAAVAQLRSAHPELGIGPGDATWVGGPLDHPYADLVRADLGSSRLVDVVRLTGPQPNLDPWWPVDGILLHLPREDPAPLVVIEAALRGVVCVTWESGGAASWLRQAGAPELVVASGDLVAAAQVAAGLLVDVDRRLALGERLRTYAACRTTDRLAPMLLGAIVGDRQR